MIIGIGCDIIKIARISSALTKDSLKRRIYTDAEIDYCESRGVQSTASFAGRFAAKEAVLKALGTGLRGGNLREIEIVSDPLGKPQAVLRGHFHEEAKKLGVKRCYLSISHTKETAMAYVVMEA